MINLDSLKSIKKLDQGFALESVSEFPNQCLQAFEETKNFSVPKAYKEVENVVIAGMGGSAYAARILKSLFLTGLGKPVELVTGYELPKYVNSKTLVILSSFSGSTEETLTIGNQAKNLGAKIAGITSGGKLAEFLKKTNYPSYIFSPLYNPSKQPRLGQGYMVIGSLMMLKALDIIDFSDNTMLEAINNLKDTDKSLNQTTELRNNPAKTTAFVCFGRIPVLFSGDIFEGALHAVRNPFNETGKQFAAYFSIPELNHHLMEGFSFPRENQDKLLVIVFESSLYSPKIKKRVEITKDVLRKNQVLFKSYQLKGNSSLSQMLEILQWGGYVTFYLGMLNGVDPSKIPWVDYFKKELAK